MGINQVIFGGETVIDLTADTVDETSLAEGVTAHNASGDVITGKMPTTTVLYTEQALTDDEKTQARINVGVEGPLEQLKSDVLVERARIDQFVALEAGSTTGDAELMDIRVGADGTTYPTAGDAVRAQVEACSTVSVSATEPTSEHVEVWIDEDTDEEMNVPEIDDSAVSAEDTWSSEKINAEISQLSSEIENVESELKETLVNELDKQNEKIDHDIKEKTRFHFEDYDLPTLYLFGDMEGMTKKNPKTLSFKFRNQNGTCSMKWQGSSSLAYPKKNYTINFDYDFEAYEGWGLHHKYVLKANWIDCSHARNIVSAKLWGQLVHNRENRVFEDITLNGIPWTNENNDNIQVNTNKFMELINGGAIDGFPVIVVLNDEFLGLYTLTIPKDAWMFGMENITTGIQGIITSEGNGASSNYFWGVPDFVSDYSVEYCSKEDGENTLIDNFKTLVQKCKDCKTIEDYTKLTEYVDLDSAIDFIIFDSLVGGADFIKNMIYGTFDGKRFFVSAYDLDTTFGNHWNGESYYKIDYKPTISGEYSIMEHRLFGLILTYDREKVKARFNELYSSVMSEENVLYMVSNFVARVPAIVLHEDWKEWKTVPSTESNNMAQILSYYRLRSSLIKNQIDGL